jgi:phage terminase small subunit
MAIMSDEKPPEWYGEAMSALRTDKQRHFALLMGLGQWSATEAATEAGYNGKGGGQRVLAHRMMQDPKILAAVREVAGKHLIGLAPLAVDALRDQLGDKSNPKARARVAETVLDRVGFSAKTEHKLTVEHKHDTAQLEEFAQRLAVEMGLDRHALLPPQSRLIEAVEAETVDLADQNHLRHPPAPRDPLP